MRLEIRTYKRLPDGSLERQPGSNTLIGMPLEAARRMAKGEVEADSSIAKATVETLEGEVLFTWEGPNA